MKRTFAALDMTNASCLNGLCQFATNVNVQLTRLITGSDTDHFHFLKLADVHIGPADHNKVSIIQWQQAMEKTRSNIVRDNVPLCAVVRQPLQVTLYSRHIQ